MVWRESVALVVHHSGLEAETSAIRAYQAQLVPGLLQTEDYTRALLKATRMTSHDADEAERFVQVRKGRQALLDQDPPVAFWIVLDEAVLRRRVGGTAVMRAQIQRLIEVADLPNVTLRILTDAAGEHAGMEGSFMILGFGEGEPDVPGGWLRAWGVVSGPSVPRWWNSIVATLLS